MYLDGEAVGEGKAVVFLAACDAVVGDLGRHRDICGGEILRVNAIDLWIQEGRIKELVPALGKQGRLCIAAP